MVNAVSIPPSQAWLGNDGSWSTFDVQIGSQGTTIQLLPSTSGEAIWVVAASLGCENQPFTNELCSKLRGGVYDIQQSSSKTIVGEYFLPFDPESSLNGNYSTDVQKGYLVRDTVQIGFDSGHAGPAQTIWDYAAQTPYVGLLGLSPRTTNISNAEELESPIQTLVNGKYVPSSYWAYNAGTFYTAPQQYGSLTFGGYDEGLANKKDFLKVPFASDNNRNLQVQINQISFSSPNLQSDPPAMSGMPIVSFIDSVVPEIWLPQSTCNSIANQFGLQYNDEYSMYLVNGTQYDEISQLNPSITLTLSAPQEAGSSKKEIEVGLPWKALVLNASYPLAGIQDGSTVWYFAMKPAANDGQYTLGRTFLQEAYLAADYDRSEFFLSQATFSTKSSIKTVQPGSSGSFGGSSSLSTGAMAGIAVGVILGVLAIVGGLLWWFCGRRWYKRRYAASTKNSRRSRGLSQSTFSTAPGDVAEFYTDDAKQRHMDEQESQRDVAAKTGLRMELDAMQTARGRFFERSELESPPIPMTPWSAASTKHGSVDGASQELGAGPEYFPSVRRTWSGQSPVELPARDENNRAERTESPERNEGELSPAGSGPTTPHEHRRMVSYP